MTEPIRYRPTLRQFPWWGLAAPVMQLFGWLVLDVRPLPWQFYAGLAVVVVAEGFWVMTFGVDVTDDALVMRGIRRRVNPWRDITWIGPAPLLGTHSVGIRYAGGPARRVRRLRAPTHTPFFAPDPDFEAKARTIYNAWIRATVPVTPA